MYAEGTFTSDQVPDNESWDETVDPFLPSDTGLTDAGEEWQATAHDLYSVLGVARDATEAEIRTAYRHWSRLLHPDKHLAVSLDHSTGHSDAETAFNRIAAAYAVLSDPDKRAIYDVCGSEGVQVGGGELVATGKSAAELRLEYILLRQKAKVEATILTYQPSSAFTFGLDMTDLFERYLREPPEDRLTLPSLSVSELSMSQSIVLSRGLRNQVSLAGQVTAQNGLGVGTLLALWQHQLAPKTPLLGGAQLETEVSYGRGGRGLSVGTRCSKQLTDCLSGSLGGGLSSSVSGGLSRVYALFPFLSAGLALQVAEHSLARVDFRWGLNGGLSSSLACTNAARDQSAHLHAGISALGNTFLSLRLDRALHWACLNPMRRSRGRPRGPQPQQTNSRPRECFEEVENDLLEAQEERLARFSLSLGASTLDLMEGRLGLACSLSETSRIFGDIGISWLRGVSLRLTLHRHSHSYIFTFRLADEFDLAASLYGSLLPLLAYSLLRAIFYQPYLRRQSARAQEVRRLHLAAELQKLRQEALATQALMQRSAQRSARAESEANGLLIQLAIYGLLSEETPSQPPKPDSGGALFVDVTIPLQVSVDNHQLKLPPGRWCLLQGFYDVCLGVGPSPGVRRLFVAYSFNGQPHQVLAEEGQGLALPMAKHRLQHLIHV